MPRISRSPAALSAFLAVVAALVLAAAGCRRPAAEPSPATGGLRLADHLAAAEVRVEPGLVDLGSPAARRILGHGWSRDETADVVTFVWSNGAASELILHLLRPRRLRLIARCRPFTHPGAPPQAVTVELNGEPLTEWVLTPGFAEHTAELPASALVAGDNRLVLRYRWVRSPAEVLGSSDRRPLAVAWDWLRFGPPETGPAPRPAADAGRGWLYLPFGSRVDLHLRLGAQAELALPRLTSRGGPGQLEVLVTPVAGDERRAGAVEAPGAGVRLSLAVPAGLVRLSLRALSASGGSAGGLVLDDAAVVTPGAASPEPTTAPGGSPPPLLAAPPAGIVVYMVDTLRAAAGPCSRTWTTSAAGPPG